jgi:ATP-dependent helicase HepA
MQRVWSHFGVSVEELAPRLYRLGAEGSFIEGFPGLPAQGLTVTLDRRRALAREDIAFLTMDHSLVTGAFDFLLARADGNAAFALCTLAGARGFWLETISVLECVAPAHLHLDRFLPPTPIHAIVDSHARDVTEQAARILAHGRLAELTARQAQERIALDRERLRALLEAVAEQAERGRARIVAEARAAMRLQVGHEIERLRALAAINQNVRPREIAALEDELRDMDEAIEHARLRLDAVRVVVLTGEAASAPNQRRRLDGETRSA